MSHAASLTLDGAPTPAAVQIPGTTLGYVHAAVTNGRHTAVCDTTFGIIVYGYGPAESYGYTGGMAFERLYTPVVVLRALDRRRRPGALDTLICVVDSISSEQEIRLSGARSLRGRLTFDATMFVPDDVSASVRDSLRSTHVWEYEFDSLRVGDTVLRIPGMHVLGRDTASAIDIYGTAWPQPSTSMVLHEMLAVVTHSTFDLTNATVCLQPMACVSTVERRGCSIQQFNLHCE